LVLAVRRERPLQPVPVPKIVSCHQAGSARIGLCVH
jgi:hypothetical protein